MSDAYTHIDTDQLVILLETHRRNLAYLQVQAAKFGTLHVPISIHNQIQDELTHINHITTALKTQNRDFDNRVVTNLVTEVRQHIQSAEIHQRVGNLESSFKSYSRAIDLMPSGDLFLARGLVLRMMGKDDKALNDLQNAIVTQNNFEIEKNARFEQLIILSRKSTRYMSEVWKNNVDWFIEHVDGRELGEVYFLRAERLSQDYYLGDSGYEDRIIEFIDKALSLGCERVDAYFYRAEAHYGKHNYGLAISDIDKAIELGISKDERLASLLSLKAKMLVSIQDFDGLTKLFKVHSDLYAEIGKNAEGSWTASYKLIEALLYAYTYDYKFAGMLLDKGDRKILKQVVIFFSNWHEEISKKHPEIGAVINQIVSQKIDE